MLNRNPAFLGQVRLLPPTYPPPIPPGGFPPPVSSPYSGSQGGIESFTSGGVCPAGTEALKLNLVGKTVTVCSPHYAVAATGTSPATGTMPPGTPQIQPPIEMPPQPLNDIGPVELPPVESSDQFYPYRTGMAPEGEGGCPPGQYHPTWSAHCVPKGGGGGFGGYGGIINMAPSATPFAMAGRAMLGRVRLVRRPY